MNRRNIFLLLYILFALVSNLTRAEISLKYKDNEGIKVYNSDSSSVDVSGWKILGQNGFTHIFPPGTLISPHEFIVIQAKKIAKITLLDANHKTIDSLTCSKTPFVEKLCNWFNPSIQTHNYFPQDNNQIEVWRGTANQKIVQPSTIGLGGKYLKKPNQTKTYLGITDINLSFQRFGNLSIHNEHLLKGEEVSAHPPKTILSWNIPVSGFALSFSKEHRWSDEFKADFSSLGIERTIGNNSTFYTRHSLQSYANGYKTNQNTVGARNTIEIIKKLMLSSQAGFWRNAEVIEPHYKTLTLSLHYFSSELSNFSIASYNNLWKHEHNHVIRLITLLPVKFNFYLGTKQELNYHDCKQIDDWYVVDRSFGLAYIPKNKFRITASVWDRNNLTSWGERNHRFTKSLKFSLKPIPSVKTSLKYKYDQNDDALTSLWLRYLNSFIELGIGGRLLHKTATYGLSIEGGIRKFNKFSSDIF